MTRTCWDLNPNCMAEAEGEAKRPCPAFKQKIGCWELDWKPLLEKVPEEQREMMGKWIVENCPQCPVYKIHQDHIDRKIRLILEDV